METGKIDVIVHKAEISLAPGESLGDYTAALNSSLKEHCKKEFSLRDDDSGCWAVEIYSSAVVAGVYDGRNPTRYYALSYERSDKEFKFSDSKEVRKIEAYVPVQEAKPTLVRKAADKWSLVSKPFPNEHAARQNDPAQYSNFARSKPAGWPMGVSVVWGIKTAGGKRKSEIQSIRFDSKKWSPADAKKWLKDHNFKTALESATNIKKSIAPDGWEVVNRLWQNIV